MEDKELGLIEDHQTIIRFTEWLIKRYFELLTSVRFCNQTNEYLRGKIEKLERIRKEE